MAERVPEMYTILIFVAGYFVLESVLLTKGSGLGPCSGFRSYFANDYRGASIIGWR